MKTENGNARPSEPASQNHFGPTGASKGRSCSKANRSCPQKSPRVQASYPQSCATRTSFTKLLRANRCFRGSRLTWGTTWVLVAKQNLTKHSIKQQVKQKRIVGDKGQSELQTNKQKTVRQSKQELSRLLTRTSFTKPLRSNRCFRGPQLTWGRFPLCANLRSKLPLRQRQSERVPPRGVARRASELELILRAPIVPR